MGFTVNSAIKRVAEDVVRRDRAGDQIAHALIVKTKQAADKGNTRAQETIKAIIAYCNSHPVSESEEAFGQPEPTPTRLFPLPPASVQGIGHLKGIVEYAGDDLADADKLVHTSQLLVLLPVHRNTSEVATVVLANGAPLTIPRIDCLASALSSEELAALFKRSVCGFPPPNGLPKTVIPVVHAGDIVGRARALQLARRPGNRLSDYDPVVGCEMGEE